MLSILLYLWIIFISFGPAYNLVGDWGVFSAMAMIVLSSRHITIEKKITACIVAFGTFIAYKAVTIGNSQAISVFHSAYGVVNTAIKLLIFIFMLQTIAPLCEQRKDILARLFNFCFHFSIVLSIIVLFRAGRNTYRYETGAGGLLLAPQIYITVTIFVIMGLVYLLLKSKKKRVLRITLILLDIIYLYMANYTTQLLFAFLGIVIVIAMGSKMKKKNRIITMLFLGIIIMVTIPILPEFIRLVSETFFATNEIVKTRLEELALLLQGGNIQGTDLKFRFDLMSRSFSAFLHDSIFGVPFSHYNTIDTGWIIGGHSEWFDDLARYGIVGMIFFCLFLYRSYQMVFKPLGNAVELKKALLLIGLLYGFANPLVRYMEFEFLYIIILMTEYYYCQERIEAEHVVYSKLNSIVGVKAI